MRSISFSINSLFTEKIRILNENREVKNFKVSFLTPREQLMKLSNDEKKQHEKFLTEMTDPIWKKI